VSRVLPHNLDAEAGVLGGILLRNQVLTEVPELEPGEFYDHKHKVVFQAIRDLEAAARPIDVVTVEHEIARAGKLEAVGGVAYLGELTLRVPIVENVVAYAAIVSELAQARAVALAASEILERCYQPELDVREYLDDAEARILKAAARRGRADDAVPVGALVRRRLHELDEIAGARARGETALTGVHTGIRALDEAIGGWQRGVVNLLAGRPAMGKSAVALAAAEAVAEAGDGVHVFSLEDSWRAYADRNLARRSGVPAERIRSAELQRQDLAPLMSAIAALRRHERWIFDDRGGLSAADIIRAVRRHRERLRTRLVIVDYVQLVRRNPRLDENAALDEIMTAFAAAAKDDDGAIAWLVLSQLNRKVEERADKRPLLSDLRGSGALEERAKVAVGLYRGAYYHAEPQKEIDYDCTCVGKTPASACQHRPTDEDFERQLQLLLLKNNNGRCGRVFATWCGPTMEAR
jgi:replicative DNA helicase